jgi:hypothetical protein
LDEIKKFINKTIYFFLGSLLVMWWTTAFGAGVSTFLWRSCLFGLVGLVSFFQGGLLDRKIEKELDKVIRSEIRTPLLHYVILLNTILPGVQQIRFEMHRQRGIENSPPTPESTEWLNACQ